MDLDSDGPEMPPTVLEEQAKQAIVEGSRSEQEEFRFESVVIDLDNLKEEELKPEIVDPPPPLVEDEEMPTHEGRAGRADHRRRRRAGLHRSGGG